MRKGKAKEPCCSKCKITDAVWSFQTTAMRRKIYLCWDHLQEVEAAVALRGFKNIY